MLRCFELPDAPEREQLRNELIRRSELSLSHPSHNRGGWRSAPDLFEWLFQPVQWLKAQAVGHLHGVGCAAATVRAWGVVNTRGAHHARHRHSGAYTWSGIYYLDRSSTPTTFELRDGMLSIYPRPGLLVLFSTQVWHSVEKCTEAKPRVTIALDAR
jgi:hypothetical protein